MKLRLAIGSLSSCLILFACASVDNVAQRLSVQPEISPEARQLFRKADALHRQGKFIESARTGELALEATHGTLPLITTDTVLLEIGGLYEKGGAPTDAIRVLTILLKHSPSSPQERRLHAGASHDLAMLLYKNDQKEKAGKHLLVAYKLAKQIGDQSLLFKVLNLRSLIEIDQDQHAAAIRTLNESLDVLPRVENPGREARLLILIQLGWQYKKVKQYDKAKAVASQYLKEAEALGELEDQAKALEFRGFLEHDQGHPLEAVDAFFAAARKASEIPDLNKAIRNFATGLDLLWELKDYDRMKRALLVELHRIDQVFKDSLYKAYLLSELGQLYYTKLGLYDLATFYLIEAYELDRNAGRHSDAAHTLIHLGKLMKFLQDPNKAFLAFSDAKEHAMKGKDANLLAVAHKYLGTLYANAGWYSDAFQEYEEARIIYHSLGRTDLVLSVDFLKAHLYEKVGDREKVREQLLRLEQSVNRDPSTPKEWLNWLGLSGFYSYLGDKSKAKAHASRAVKLARDANDADGQIQSLSWLGLLMADDFAAFDESISLYQQAISIAKEEGAAQVLSGLQGGLGLVFLSQGRLKDAIKAFEMSIVRIESALERIHYSDTRVSFAQRSLSPYDGLIRALYLMYRQDKDPRLAGKALLIHERSRAREFARMLTTNRIEEIGNMLPENLRKLEDRLAWEIKRLKNETHSYEQDEGLLKEKLARLKTMQARYDKLISEIQANYPQYAITRLRDLGKVTNLPIRSGEAILVYRFAPGISRVDPSGIFVWVLTPSPKGAEIQAFARINANLPLPIGKAIGSFMGTEPGDVSQESLKLLSEVLLKPVSSKLTNVSRLTIVRDGDMGRLPFEMLPSPDDSGLMVLDRWAVGYYPSLLTMAVNRSTIHSGKDRVARALLVGDVEYGRTPESREDHVQRIKRVHLRSGKSLETLPFSAVEIEKIGKLFKFRQVATTILRQDEASERQIKKLDLEEFQYLHFAVHGLQANEILGVKEPSLALAISENGDDAFLTASEVMGLKLNAEMVVLSACDTALGKYHQGEGFSNLARAFMSAGAEGVIVSQWAVADQSTAELMVELYENLARGQPIEEALRAAKITLRKRYPSPYYWAPFILIGG